MYHLCRGGLVCEEEEEDADQTGRISSSQAKRVKPWQEQVLLEQAQQEHVSPYVEYVKHENSTNYLYGHPTDERVEAKLSAPTNNWSFLSSSPKSCITSYGTTNNLLNFSNISKSNARHPQQNRSLEVCILMGKVEIFLVKLCQSQFYCKLLVKFNHPHLLVNIIIFTVIFLRFRHILCSFFNPEKI